MIWKFDLVERSKNLIQQIWSYWKHQIFPCYAVRFSLLICPLPTTHFHYLCLTVPLFIILLEVLLHTLWIMVRILYVLMISLSNQNVSRHLWPICSQCTLSVPPENIRKPYGFLMFSGSREGLHWKQMG